MPPGDTEEPTGTQGVLPGQWGGCAVSLWGPVFFSCTKKYHFVRVPPLFWERLRQNGPKALLTGPGGRLVFPCDPWGGGVDHVTPDMHFYRKKNTFGLTTLMGGSGSGRKPKQVNPQRANGPRVFSTVHRPCVVGSASVSVTLH